MVDKPLPADRAVLVAHNVALLTLGQAGLYLHHLHIVRVRGGGGGVPKVENVPGSKTEYLHKHPENTSTVDSD